MLGSSTKHLPYLWDYDISEDEFRSVLEGRSSLGRLDQDWAAVRLIEYAPYKEIIRLLGFRQLVAGWPRWRGRIRSVSRKRGLDFLIEYVSSEHAEKLNE